MFGTHPRGHQMVLRPLFGTNDNRKEIRLQTLLVANERGRLFLETKSGGLRPAAR